MIIIMGTEVVQGVVDPEVMGGDAGGGGEVVVRGE